MTMSRRQVILDVNDQVSEDSKVEIVAMSPMFSSTDLRSNQSSKINSPSKGLENFEQECDNYEKLINDLKNLQPTVVNAKRDLSLILKRVSKDTFETVSSILNVDHIINNHISNIHKIQRQNYKNDLYSETNKKMLSGPGIRIHAEKFKAIQRHIETQWVDQFYQSFYYINNNECISRWMHRMMKDKTSFWFDQITYDKIRNDYREVRQNFTDYIQDKPIKSPRKKSNIRESEYSEIKAVNYASDREDVSAEVSVLSPSKDREFNTSFADAHDHYKSLYIVTETNHSRAGSDLESPKSLDKARKMTEQAKSRQAMSPRSGYHQFITDVHYFQGEGEEHEVSDTFSDLKLVITPTLPEEELRDSDSAQSKTIEESSITTSTKVPGKDDIFAKNEIKVIDCLVTNTFVKLSDF